MPTKTRTAYAQVNTGTGSPKSGIQVNLKLEVVPEDDGYNHAVGQHTVPHQGSLSAPGGTTGTDGRLNFEFKAPVAGGIHTITASCTNCTNQATGTITVPGCPVPPLTSPPFTDPVAQGFENGNRWRPDLLTADYQTKLACVEAKIDTATGVSQSYTGTSAYRPFQYQQHLFEIVKKDKDALNKPRFFEPIRRIQFFMGDIARFLPLHPATGVFSGDLSPILPTQDGFPLPEVVPISRC